MDFWITNHVADDTRLRYTAPPMSSSHQAAAAGGGLSAAGGQQQQQQQRSKLKIKPLRAKPKLPENFGEATWSRLSAFVSAVHSKVLPLISGAADVLRWHAILFRAFKDAGLYGQPHPF